MMTGDKLKKIRLEIKQAKNDNNQNLMFQKLADFQKSHSEQDFACGLGEIYRYPKVLEKLGFIDEARQQRNIVDEALFNFKKAFKKIRIEQIKHSKYIRFASAEYNKDFQCDCNSLDGIIDRTENIEYYKAWLDCRAKCCTIAIYGESERSLIRKNIDLPM